MALASGAPLWVEKRLWEALKRPAAAKLTPTGSVRLDVQTTTAATTTTTTTRRAPKRAAAGAGGAAAAAAAAALPEVQSAATFRSMTPEDKVV